MLWPLPKVTGVDVGERSSQEHNAFWNQQDMAQPDYLESGGSLSVSWEQPGT